MNVNPRIETTCVTQTQVCEKIPQLSAEQFVFGAAHSIIKLFPLQAVDHGRNPFVLQILLSPRGILQQFIPSY